MADFFEMGGYAQFVWPAYIVSAAAIAGLTIYVWRRGKTLREKLKRLEDAQPGNSPSHDSE
ncbi:MAG: heme exporter protein CcmD [Parvularculaceae bacterium]